jgi:hypothetical protein
VESAAHERNVGNAVQVTEHAHAIHHDHIGICVVGCTETHRREPARRKARLERGEMLSGRLVRSDHEANARFGCARPGEGREKHAFVRRPGRPCNECRTIAGEGREKG